MELRIADIRRDGGTQLRVGSHEFSILAYTAAMQAGSVFPPITVFRDNAGTHWLADGFQRTEATLRCGRDTITADVRLGDLCDAILFACGANDEHGTRRSDADKSNAVNMLMAHQKEGGKWPASDNAIAKACKVSHSFVANIRRIVADNAAYEAAERSGRLDSESSGVEVGESPKKSEEKPPAKEGVSQSNKGGRPHKKAPRVVVAVDGRTMNVENIGKRKSKTPTEVSALRRLWKNASRNIKFDLISEMKTIIANFEKKERKT